MTMQVADAFVRYLADTKELDKAVGPDGAVAQSSARGAKTVGDRFSTAFKRTATAGGAAAGVFFTASLESATKLEDELRTINTVAGLSDGELAKLGDSVQELSRETGRSTSDLTAGLYDLVSAGVPAGEAIGVLRDSAKLAVGALGTTGEAVDAVTSALNAYELGAGDSTRVTDILAKAVQDGKVTISEIGSSIANIAPIAASAGISLEEVSAGYAALTAKGVPAAQAATQMRSAISALLTPNEKLNEIQEATGINFAELAKAEGLAVALDKLRESTGGNDEAFGKALGSVEAYQFALATTGENAEEFQNQITETLDATGIANEQYAEKSKSALEQGRRLFAGFETFAQDIGGPLVGTLGSSVFALNELGRAFGIPVGPAKLLGGVIGGIAGRAVPLLISGIGGVVSAVAPALTAMVGGMGTIVTAALAAWPLLLVAAVVAAVIFLVNNPEIVAAIGEFIGSVLEWIGAFLEDLPQLLVDVFSFAFAAVVDLVPKFVGAVVDVLLKLPGMIAGLFGAIVGLYVKIWTKIITTAVDFVGKVVGFILSIPGKVVSLLPKLAAFFGQIGTNLQNKAREFIGNIVEFFLALPGRIASVGGRIVSSIIRGMASLPGKLANVIGNAFRNLRIDIGPFHISGSGISIDMPNIQLPSFDVGTSFVPADMMAMVHQGEIIIPRREAEAVREGRLAIGSKALRPDALYGNTGTSVVIHAPIQGLLQARNPFEAGDQMARIAGFYLKKDDPDG